jgi:hypothetical protein
MDEEKYKIYREPLKTYEEYYSTWDFKTLTVMGEAQKQNVYAEYFCRHKVLNRDNFECQVDECTFKDSPLTIHHYKHKSNGGPTKERNCVTVCRAHQTQYHKGRHALKYKSNPLLPAHIRGQTQALDIYVKYDFDEEEIEPVLGKQKLHEMRLLRKTHKEMWGKEIPWDLLMMLFRWITEPYPVAG